MSHRGESSTRAVANESNARIPEAAVHPEQAEIELNRSSGSGIQHHRVNLPQLVIILLRERLHENKNVWKRLGSRYSTAADRILLCQGCVTDGTFLHQRAPP